MAPLMSCRCVIVSRERVNRTKTIHKPELIDLGKDLVDDVPQ